ncbi:MFS transporter [Nonomuraea sp. NPDC050643]|uniref:MFS transporter n=1 Tax=Nonomuraea sp. NPDC050643 TaxID=3155660 RepID=UPI0033C3C0D4
MSGTVTSERRAPTPAAEFATAGSLFAQKNFLLFWGGQTISKVGNGAYKVTLGWSVYELTGSTAAMGLLLALNVVPEIVFLLVGGAIADRFPRRGVILVADGLACVVLLGLALAAAAGHLTLGLLATTGFALGVISAFYGPAYAAMNRDLISDGQFRKANAFFTATDNLARLAGPVLGGALYAMGGAATVFTVNAVSFAVAVAAMLLTRTARGPAPVTRQNLRRDLAEGIGCVRRTRSLLLLLLISVVANCVCLAPYLVLLPDLVRAGGNGLGVLGLLNTAEIAAVLLSALLIGRLGGRGGAGKVLLMLTSALGLACVVLGMSGNHLAALFAGAVLVGAGLSSNIVEHTLLQTLVPPDLLSRVYSVNMVFSFSFLPVAYAVSGVLARHFGTHAVLLVGGLALIALCAYAFFRQETKSLNAVGW